MSGSDRISGEYGAEDIFVRLREKAKTSTWAEALCREIAEATGSGLTAFYRIPGGKKTPRWAYLGAQTGYVTVPERLPLEREDLRIAVETGLAVVQNSSEGPFPGLLLSGEMRSGVAVCLGGSKLVSGLSGVSRKPKASGASGVYGVLIANHGSPFFYTAEVIGLLERLGRLLGGPEA